MNVSLEFGLVKVAESQIGLDTILLLVLDGGEIEGEKVLLKKVLVDHFIENWGDSSLGEGWVSQTNNSLEVRPSENSMLLLYITKLLILNMNLST